MEVCKVRGGRPHLSTTLILLAMVSVQGHIDFDRYEIYTRASTRAVINSFKVMATAVPWNAAKRKCEAENAHLVVPDSADEVNVLGLLFKKLPKNAARHFHVGLTDHVEGGVWLSVFGGVYTVGDTGRHFHVGLTDHVEGGVWLPVFGGVYTVGDTGRHFHVGLTDHVEGGVWLSVFGGKSQSPWGGLWGEKVKVSGEASLNTTKNCAVLREGNSTLDAEDCEAFLSPYVCEKEQAAEDPDPDEEVDIPNA